MWSVGGDVKYIPATFNSEEGVKKGLAKTQNSFNNIPDWDAQFKAQRAEEIEAAEPVTNVQAALQLGEKLAADAKKFAKKVEDPEYPMLDSDEDTKRQKKRKHKKKRKRNDNESGSESDDSSSSSSSSSSDDSSTSSDSDSDSRAKRKKDKRRKKEREEKKREKKKKSKKSKKVKKEKRDKSEKKSRMNAPVRLSEFLNGDGSGSDDDGNPDVPRSAISGRKIQLKVKRNADDKEEERKRKKYLKKLNAFVTADEDA